MQTLPALRAYRGQEPYLASFSHEGGGGCSEIGFVPDLYVPERDCVRKLGYTVDGGARAGDAREAGGGGPDTGAGRAALGEGALRGAGGDGAAGIGGAVGRLGSGQ